MAIYIGPTAVDELDWLARHALSVSGVVAAAIHEAQPDGSLRNVAAALTQGAAGENSAGARNSSESVETGALLTPAPDSPLGQSALATRELSLIPLEEALAAFPDPNPLLANLGAGGYLLRMYLWHRGESVGLMVLALRQPPSTHERLLIQQFASEAGRFLGELRNLALPPRSPHGRRYNLAALLRFSEAALLGTDADFPAALQSIVERLRMVLSADVANISLVDDDGETVSPRARSFSAAGRESGAEERMRTQYSSEMGVVAWVRRTRRSALIANAKEDSRGRQRDREGPESVIAAPLSIGGKLLGVLRVVVLKPAQLGPSELRLVESLAQQVAVAIENARLYQSVRDQNVRLTELYEETRRQKNQLGIFAHIFSASPEAMILLDRNGEIQECNPAAERLYGYERAELIGQAAGILLSEGNVPDLLALIDQRLEKSSHWVGEVQARRKDGSEFLAKVERSLVRDDDQTILGSVEVARDLTEKKQMEAELLHAERLRALGVTASGVAHQINNVLGSVVGQADLLRLQLSDRASQEQLETIIRAAQDGVEAVRRIQRFSRETPQEPFEPVELEALVRDVVRTTAPRWRDESRREGRPIHLVAESDGPVWTEGLPAELRELLMNLVFNAVDALPVGGTIKIRLEASGDVARLRVKDTGIGMTEDVAAKVFEPFFTTKPGGRGTGLGLALAYATVQRHGGRIQVKSRPGQGTEFEILLRQRDVAGPQVPISLTSGMAPQRLLVVDDDIAQANRLAAVLRHDGHQVEVCGSGEQGIAALESRPFDLVLTALVMPVVSGWDVTREAKRRIPHVRVGLLAGWSEDIDPARLAVAGVDFVLSKPYRTEQVRAAIAKAMRAPDANKIVA